jgi:hypothetical protein
MPFNDRQYDLFVMLGNPAVEPAWFEVTWQRIAATIDPLIQSARSSAAVRSTQLKVGSGSPNQRAISFGRIGWNIQGHKKWVQASRSDDREFISSEVWAPSWSTCEREARAPDTYFAIRNEQSSSRQQVSFNPICILAVARDQSSSIIEQGRKSAEAIAQILETVLRVHCARPWGYRFGEVAFTNAIGDLIVTGLFKPRPRPRSPVTALMLNGKWEAF